MEEWFNLRKIPPDMRGRIKRYLLHNFDVTRGTRRTLLYGEKGGTKRVLEYALLAMGFANVRASRYEIR